MNSELTAFIRARVEHHMDQGCDHLATLERTMRDVIREQPDMPTTVTVTY